MPSKNAYIARALSLALITGFLCGCNWLGLSERSQSQAGDLVLDLGNRTRMYFVWVDPLQLFVGQYEVSNKIFRRFHPDEGKHFTWWSNRPGVRAKNHGWRIDYAAVSENLWPTVRRAWHEPDQMGSDHCPIGLELR